MATYVVAALFIILVGGCHGVVVERLDPPLGPPTQGLLRDVTLADRYNCSDGDIQPGNRVDTGERVARLRQEMANYGLDAYIVFTMDEHQNEYTMTADLRVKYISGFSGSNGQVVVTMTEQALWTDGRYFLQADNQMDCNWLLMKSGLEGVPTMMQWIKDALPSGARVGSDPAIVPAQEWMAYESSLEEVGISMIAEETNLVDIIWTDRPLYPTDPAFVLELFFAGKTWEDKLSEVRTELTNKGVDLLVVTPLDNLAWLLNLRGSDIPYNAVFRGYVLVGLDRVHLYTPPEKVTQEVQDHLQVDQCDITTCVQIFDYDSIEDALRALEDDPAVSSILVSSSSSYSIYNAVPSSKRVPGGSPIPNIQAIKNEVEKQGMRNAHIKDGVALCDFFAFMEKEIDFGAYWDEISAANVSLEFRSQQANFFSESFETISGFGPNGAVIHYRPDPSTNLPIDSSSLYLLDSGAQFFDGTTDVTRTVHFGTPKPFEIEAYTRVLQGQLDFADLIFPVSAHTSYSKIDILARKSLYGVGLDYRHGTSHGVGMFLSVHEHTNSYFQEGEFMSDEPGYYEDGNFGIRLENTIEVVQATTPYDFTGPSLTFQHITLVPYETKLIDTTILTPRQCTLVNDYHMRVLEVVGQELLNQGKQDTYDWLVNKIPLLC